MPTYRVQTDTGIFTVESPTPITSEAQMQQALNGGGQGLKISSEPPEQPLSRSFMQRFKQGLVKDTTKGIEDYLVKGGWPQARAAQKAAQIGGWLQSGTPGTPADVGRLLLPFLVGRFVPAGRTAARVGGQILGNVAGSALLEGGQEALSGKGLLGGAMTGAIRGLPGGVTQATIGAALGPNKATIQAQEASAMARLRNIFSPAVRASIPEDPKAILSKRTADALVKTAGASLDTTENSIRSALAPQKGMGQKGLQAKFDFLRARIKSLRDIGEGPRMTPELRGAAKKAATDAQRLEVELVQMLEKNGFQAQAQLYRSTIQQYAQDRAQIRVLKAIQRTQNLPGGVNRADNPETAELVDALQAPTLSGAARATFMTALVALRHPFMALHFARGGAGKGFIDPQKVQVPRFGKAAGPLGAVGGAAASLTATDEPE